jgi:ABC-type multidrug transport system ATPase subunit
MAPQESPDELNEAEAMKVVDLNIPQGDRDKEDEAVDEADKVSETATATETETDKKSVLMKKTSSIFSIRDGHTLEFDNIKLSTQSKNHEKNPPKQILKGISGNFPPNTLTAVMGPSGSGKTSLLKILTGRIGGSNSKLDLDGEIRLDYNAVDPTDIDVRREIAYVEQDVSIPATCTPREAITFSARLRLDKSLSDLEISDVVNEILENLGLQKCADTLIGGGILMAGGLSGGEKKRVQCGVELVTNPEIIVLDEPTSGLDSYSAQNLMEVLKKIADAGATVIVTIHQPPPPVVRKIDNLFLLLAGRLMYTGPMGIALERKFTDFGYPRPDDYNIADWILQVAQANPIEELEKAGFFDDVNKQQQKYDEDSDTKSLSKAALVKKAAAAAKSPSVEHVGLAIQTRLLFDREIKKLYRDKFSFVVRVGSTTVFGLLFGLIFLNIGRAYYVVYPEVMASFGAIANLLISTMFGVAQSSLTEFPKDRPVFLREYSTNHYSVLPYFLAKFSIECFTILCQVLVQQIAAFFLMGFQMNFFLFLMINFLLAIASTSIGIFIGSCVEDPGVAAELMPALIVPQLLFSGFFIPTQYIPSFLRWAQYTCSLTYAIRLASLYEFGDCPTSSCQSLLENNGVHELPSYWYWIILFLIAATFRITSMVILKRKASF